MDMTSLSGPALRLRLLEMFLPHGAAEALQRARDAHDWIAGATPAAGRVGATIRSPEWWRATERDVRTVAGMAADHGEETPPIAASAAAEEKAPAAMEADPTTAAAADALPAAPARRGGRPSQQPDLTPLYDWLVECAGRGEPCPTNKAIAVRFGWRLAAGTRNLQELQRRGLITIESGRRWRIVTIVATGARTADQRRPPTEAAPPAAPEQQEEPEEQRGEEPGREPTEPELELQSDQAAPSPPDCADRAAPAVMAELRHRDESSFAAAPPAIVRRRGRMQPEEKAAERAAIEAALKAGAPIRRVSLDAGAGIEGVVTWLRSQNFVVVKLLGRYLVDGRKQLTPKDLVAFANERRQRRGLEPFVVEVT